jgi:hypothetical protein
LRIRRFGCKRTAAHLSICKASQSARVPTFICRTSAGSSSSGSTDGTGAGASFNGPLGLTVDATGNTYIADTGNNEIRMIGPTGVVTTTAGHLSAGNTNGTALPR